MKALRPGIALQELVAALERTLAQSEGVTIESPKFLPDKDTGRRREHDVVITRRDAHHTILTAIEVKDTGRKVGVPQIEAFSKKCEKTGVHHRVIVSGSGFTKSASAKADALDIACIHLSEAEAFDWMGLEFFVRIERNIPHINATVFFKASKPTEPFKVVDRNGVEVTPAHMASMIYEAMRQNDIEAPVGEDTPILVQANTEQFFGIGAEGEKHEIDFMELEATVVVRSSSSPARLHTYVGSGANYAVVTTDAPVGDKSGQLLFVRDDERIRMAWSPTKRP